MCIQDHNVYYNYKCKLTSKNLKNLMYVLMSNMSTITCMLCVGIEQMEEKDCHHAIATFRLKIWKPKLEKVRKGLLFELTDIEKICLNGA